MGKAVLYFSMAGAAIFLVWEIFFKKKDKPVGDALSAASSLSVAEVSAKAEAIREKMKKPKKWIWITGIIAVIGSAVTGAWFFLGKKPGGPDSLYQLGFLGMPAPAGFDADRRYLAGVMKKQREDRFHDLAAQGAKTLAGLPIKGVTAQFGKVYHNENYQQNSQWKNKF